MTACSREAALRRDVARETFVVIPAFDEAETIAAVVRELLDRHLRVVVVDDGSGDATAARARAQGASVLRHVVNRGQGAALQTGIRYALLEGARYVVTFDADGQHRPDDVARLLAPLLAGEVEVTLGSRFLGGAPDLPFGRRLLLKLGILFTLVVDGVRLSDAHNGLRAFTRHAAEMIDIRFDRMAHASELIALVRRARWPFREVAVEVRYTERSLAKGQRSGSALRIAADYVVGRILH